MKKRFISMLLSLCMVISICLCMPISASAETSGTCGENLTWVLDDDGTLTISGSGEMPKETDFYDIKDYIKKIVIEDGITSISNYAFEDAIHLKEIFWGNDVKIIGSCSFYGCHELKQIDIPDSVITIGNCAFGNCQNLSVVNIGDGVKTIDKRAFDECENLCIVSIGNNVISIGKQAFGGCSVSEIYIPESVVTIDSMAFFECASLENIFVDNENKYFSVHNNALYNKTKSELILCPITVSGSYSIPNTVTTIKEHAFAFCENLTSVHIPSTVEYIGTGAFFGCYRLTSIKLPEKLTYFGEAALAWCASMSEITIENNEHFCSENGILYSKNKETLIQCPGGKICNIIMPTNVKKIASGAFSGCCNLKSINIPSSVSEIGTDCFSECYNLKEIILTDGLRNIGEYAFAFCEEIKEITIPKSVISIGDEAFYGCEGLTKITILSPTTKIIHHETIDGLGNNVNFTIPESATIYGYTGSTAEEYANLFKRKFETLGIISPLTISAPTNSYAGTYYTFEATFDTMPTSSFLQFDSPADGWTWFSDEYCSTNPVFNIPTDEIVEKDGKYVYQTSFVIYSSGNTSDSHNRQVRVAADINGTRQYSEGAKFVVKPTPERSKNTIGYLYEQTSNPSGDTVAPEIKDVEVTKVNGKYRLTIKDITAENEDWVFFYWQTDSGEFEKVTDDFKTVDLIVSGGSTVTVTMGDGCGYITTKTIEIN